MGERTVTLQGNPFTLLGDEVKVGDKTPEFVAVGNDLGEFRLSSTRGKIRIIASVPSLDTPVCATETRRFNEEAAKLGADVRIIVVSADLPFAQARWCGAEGIAAVRTVSDHRDTSFGQAYGMLIRELRLLARAVFVVDRDDTVRYVELVREIAEEPSYDAVLRAAKALV